MGVNCSLGTSDGLKNVPRVFALAVKCAVEAGDRVIPPVCGRTVRAWHRQYIGNIDDIDEDAYGAFNPDDRGHTQRNWIMNENDMKEKFTQWMKNNLKTLSMLCATQYVNNVLLKDESPELLARYGLSLPVSDTIVLAWMHKCGAFTCWYKTSYYNDAHDRPDVLAYRNTIYIPKSEEIELRMHIWWQLEAADFAENVKPTLDQRLLQEALHAPCDGSTPNVVPMSPPEVFEQPPRGGCRVKQVSTGLLGTVNMSCDL